MLTAAALACLLIHRAPDCALPGDGAEVTAAIDAELAHEGLRAVVVRYAWGESRFRLQPHPESPDALDGRSCGFLQMPCYLVRHMTPREQVRTWIGWVQSAGLASVDSSSSRATRRAQEARRLLSE